MKMEFQFILKHNMTPICNFRLNNWSIKGQCSKQLRKIVGEEMYRKTKRTRAKEEKMIDLYTE